jgi:hypothetical protein
MITPTSGGVGGATTAKKKEPLLKRASSMVKGLGILDPNGTAPGRKTIEGNRDRWGKALEDLPSVYTPTALTAGAKALVGGLAGWQRSKAEQQEDAGKKGWSDRMSRALMGEEDPRIAMTDEWADPADKATLLRMWERENPGAMDRLSMDNTRLGMDRARQDMDQNQQLFPHQLKGAELGNQRTQQTMDFETQMQPYQLEGAELGNQSTQQQLDQNKQLFPMQLEGAEQGLEKGRQDLAQGEQRFDVDMQKARLEIETAKKQLDQLGKGKWTPHIGSDGSITYLSDDPNQPPVTTKIKIPQKQDLPSAVEEYNFMAEQERAAGREPPSFADWETSQKKASATSVNMGGAKDDTVFKTMAERSDAARAALRGINSMREAKRALQSGAITGSFANERLALQRLGAWFGVADPEIIENTETFRSAMAPQVAAMLKATVGSTQVSNADREFAAAAAAGSIELNERSIARLIDIMERGNVAIIDDFQQTLDDVYPDEGNDNRGVRSLFGVDDPDPQGDMPTITDDAAGKAAYDQLPPNTVFTAPDGTLRIK